MKKKEWTVLIYSNGNNEIEPEIWKSKLNLESKGSTKDINIVMQIARAPKELVEIIRPQEKIDVSKELWAGTRRYYINKGESNLIEELTSINMADYKSLYNFIMWGMKEYPAKKYMVVISGHGFLVAALSDICGDKPYTLGVYEMCNILNNINKSTGNNIDILVLDICNMNNIEIIYELGRSSENTVKNVLTYIEEGPLSGMPYEDIIKLMEYNLKIDTKELLSKIVEEINLELVAIEVNHQKLNKIKELLNRVGMLQLSKNSRNTNFNYDEFMYNKYKQELSKVMLNLIINYSVEDKNKFPIKIITGEMYDIENLDLFLSYYNKLSITKNNYWANVVGKKAVEEPLNVKNSIMEQHILTKENIYTFIKVFNQNLDDNKCIELLKKLCKYKMWKI